MVTRRERQGRIGKSSSRLLNSDSIDEVLDQVDKEKRELQSALRSAKIELQKRTEELSDVQEELAMFKESSKEREKALKAKYRAATEERERLASIQVGVADWPAGKADMGDTGGARNS